MHNLSHSIHHSIDIKFGQSRAAVLVYLFYCVLPGAVTCMQAVVAAAAAVRVVQVVAAHFPAGRTRGKQTAGSNKI